MAIFCPSGCTLIFGDYSISSDGLIYESDSGSIVFYGDDAGLIDVYNHLGGSCFPFAMTMRGGSAKRFNASAELVKMENGSTGLRVNKRSDGKTNLIS